jgi:hypothetical protein
MVRGVLERLWNGFVSSYDVEAVLAASSPRGTVFAVSALVTLTLLVGYLPACQAARFEAPGVALAFALLGGAATAVAWRHGCVGPIGGLATLLDNAFYVAALSWGAANTSQPYGLFFAACLAAMLLGFQSTFYGLSALMTIAVAVPPAVIVGWAKPDPLVQLAIAGAVLLSLVRMALTSEQYRRSWLVSSKTRPALRGESGLGYRLGPRLGKGGMGVVHRAVSERGELFAVKVLRDVGTDEVRLRRTLREALTVNRVQHPGVVPIVDYGMPEDGPPFLVMALLDGRTLAEAVAAAPGGLPWPEATRLILPVLEALEAVHATGIVHCDVKPNNVFLCKDGRVKLLDFGVAHCSEDLLDLTLSLRVVGTPACMAPEQVLTPSEVSPRADVWGAAACLFHALSGAWPRAVAESCRSLEEVVRAPCRPIESLKPGLPANLARAVNVGLARDPEARWSSAREFGEQLKACLKAPLAPASRRVA